MYSARVFGNIEKVIRKTVQVLKPDDNIYIGTYKYNTRAYKSLVSDQKLFDKKVESENSKTKVC